MREVILSRDMSDPSSVNQDLTGYISVDIEASGPTPGEYSILAIGAVSLVDSARTFYVELKPASDRADPEAMAVHGLSLEDLGRTGAEPAEAIRRFDTWCRALAAPGHSPVFVAYNAAFDWMFLNDAFQRTVGHNPFGYAPLDLRAWYAGQSGAHWQHIHFDDLADRYLGGRRRTHNALDDARVQADLFRALLGSSVAV